MTRISRFVIIRSSRNFHECLYIYAAQLCILAITIEYDNYSFCSVYTGFRGTYGTGAPVAYNDIEPNMTNCLLNSDAGDVFCGVGSVLGDGDIGPTHSVDVSDPDQIRRFFVWNRDNGSVTLQFVVPEDALFDVSYVNIYKLTVPSASIGQPGSIFITGVDANGIQTGHILKAQSCSFSSSTNTLFKDTYTIDVTE